MKSIQNSEGIGSSTMTRRKHTQTAWETVLTLTRAASFHHKNTIVRLHSMNLGVTAIVISEELSQLKSVVADRGSSETLVSPHQHNLQIMEDVYNLIETGSMYSMAEVLLVLWSLHLHKNCSLCCSFSDQENEDVYHKGLHATTVVEKQVAQLVKDVEHYWQQLDCLSKAKLR